MNIKKAIHKIVEGKDLTEKEMSGVFRAIMSGKATSAQIAAFIVALNMKGVTVDEITGAAKVMREKAVRVTLPPSKAPVVDTCGTGGTGVHTFNISTTVAFVLAGCGVKVAKHGNRAVSGRSGSADVLERLGVKINVPVRRTEKCIKDLNIGFLFAPLFHGAMKHAAGPRKEIGLRTVFNILGPLSNPAGVSNQLLGVFDPELTEPMARVLGKLGSKHAFVVHGYGPLDEVSTIGRTKVSELKSGKVKTYYVTPGTFGVKKASLRALKGGTAAENALILRSVLSGNKGPKRDIVLVNASMALVAAGRAKNFKEGMFLAAESIDSGEAAGKLEGLILLTNR
jgi:anthranilate phosphoribosyltransferase